MDSYRSSVVESLCALVSCCYTVPPAHASTSADDDIYVSQQQQQSKRLPWFLGGKEDTNISTETLTNSRDDVLAANSTAIGPANQPPPRWIRDDHIDTCTQCSSTFDLLTRKHHCRACGLVFCKNCTSQRERVIKYGFPEPVRVCLACSIDARAENAFYEKHLPLLEQGAVFVKRGLLLKRLVEFKFIRTKLLFQYQTLDSDTRLPVANEIKAFALDNITDVKQVSIDRENGMLSLLILVGPNNEEHRFDASTPEQKQQWLAAIESLRSLRSTLVGRERDRRAKQAEAQHNEMLKVTESMKQLEERKASFRQERIQKRAEQREILRAKYKLGSSSSNVNATTA